MKYFNTLLIACIWSLNGCTHYESRVALGAIAGASTGALIVDSTYRNNSNNKNITSHRYPLIRVYNSVNN